MPALHKTDRLWSLRHAPTWLLLTAAAGAINVTAFCACRRFVSHVTGSVSNVALDASIDVLLPLSGFILGALVSGLLIDARFHRRSKPLYALPLVASAGCIVAAACLGAAGAFGPFGDTADAVHDSAFLALLAFAMGLLNAAAATTTALAIRPTHMTGAATDLGVHLAIALRGHGEARKRAIGCCARAALLGAFIVGGVGGALLSGALEYFAFLVPALAIGAASALSFIDTRPPTEKEA